MVKVIRKRRLRDEKESMNVWVEATVQERLNAVEKINLLGEKEYVEQAFPRVYRITRKARG
jgi:uncharacterized protein YqgV (UPF0045/DUF77 family)